MWGIVVIIVVANYMMLVKIYNAKDTGLGPGRCHPATFIVKEVLTRHYINYDFIINIVKF